MAVPMMILGALSVGLGVWHLGVPAWFHFRLAVRDDAVVGLPPVRLAPVRYGTTARDVLGVAWIMNLAASYGLITIGIACLASPLWIGTPAGRVLALWMGGWWAVRAAAQLAMGRRRVDLAVMAVFGAAAAVSLAAGLG
jgi:hypothetical protein